jgi:hypothetical protein
MCLSVFSSGAETDYQPHCGYQLPLEADLTMILIIVGDIMVVSLLCDGRYILSRLNIWKIGKESVF